MEPRTRQLLPVPLIVVGALLAALLVSFGTAGPARADGLLTFTPNPVAFELMPVGVAVGLPVDVRNSSGAALQVADVSIAGADADQFWIYNNNCPGELAPDASCTVWVAMEATRAGSFTAELTVQVEGATGLERVPLTGAGQEWNQPLAPLPLAMELGDVPVNEQTQRGWVVVNMTGPTMPPQTVTWGAPPVVEVLSATGEIQLAGTDCGNGPLNPWASCVVEVAFAPTSRGAKSATMRMTYTAYRDDGTSGTFVLNATVTGTGVREPAAEFSAAPDPVAFPDRGAGSVSGQRVVTVTNTGDRDLVLRKGSVSVAGADADQFQLASDRCSASRVAPGASCVVAVKFAPTTAGEKAAVVQFDDNAPGAPHEVGLSGTGLAGVFTATPDPLTFPNRGAGSVSAQRVVTVTNTGTADLVFRKGSVSVAGADSGQFQLASDRCSASRVAPGASCVVAVKFAPTTAGEKAAVVRFADDAPGAPHDVRLSGTGLAGEFTATPNPVAFGNQQVGVQSRQKTVKVTNTGNAPITFKRGAVTWQGGDNNDFLLTVDHCSARQVAPGGSCAVAVEFAPMAAGEKAAVLRFTDNAPGSPHDVNVTGTGIG